MSAAAPFFWPGGWPLLLALPLLWLALFALEQAGLRRLARVAGARAPFLAADLCQRKRRVRRGFFLGACLLALLAALQPTWGEGARTLERRGADLLICLDVSRSMLAPDLAPTRLERAQQDIRQLCERARGDRFGLVACAGEAQLIVPLTRDLESFASLAEAAGPLSVGRGGTDLGAALACALEALGGRSGEHEAVLLLSDGEDLEGRGAEVARACRERGITVHCVGFGSALGSKIALAEAGGEAFLRDRSGAEVVSALDAAGLRRIAEAAGGEYLEAAATAAPLLDLYEARVLEGARRAFEAEVLRGRENRFQWPLAAALLLWLLELLLTDRRRR